MASEKKTDSNDAQWLKAQKRTFVGLEHKYEGKRVPFFFANMADPQLGFLDGNLTWNQEEALCEQAVAILNKIKPRFAIVCGDIANAFPIGSEPAGYKEAQVGKGKRGAQVTAFKKIMSNVSAEIPLICLCGNHDVGNRPTAESIKSWAGEFGDDYFSFSVNECYCIVLNSSLLCDSSAAPDLYKQHMDWLDGELARVKELKPWHCFVFLHHPLFLADPDEQDGYFQVPTKLRLPLLEKLHAAGVRHVFAGHYHQNAGGRYKELEHVTTSAWGRPLGSDPSGFRVVRVLADGRVDHEYYALADVPAVALDQPLPKPKQPSHNDNGGKS